ncbi:hypothetical protein K440DRAFT_612147, partial [Wilcoxina mikolae CBS 423.85]
MKLDDTFTVYQLQSKFFSRRAINLSYEEAAVEWVTLANLLLMLVCLVLGSPSTTRWSVIWIAVNLWIR